MGQANGKRPETLQRLFPSPSKKMIRAQMNADFQDVVKTNPFKQTHAFRK